MNFTKEKVPAFVLEDSDILKIRELRVLGIYTFVKMMMNQGEYTVPIIIDKMKEQFFIEEKELLEGLKIIIEDLLLITMIKNED